MEIHSKVIVLWKHKVLFFFGRSASMQKNKMKQNSPFVSKSGLIIMKTMTFSSMIYLPYLLCFMKWFRHQNSLSGLALSTLLAYTEYVIYQPIGLCLQVPCNILSGWRLGLASREQQLDRSGGHAAPEGGGRLCYRPLRH